MAVKCLWNWLNPVDLPPGCHCAQSSSYLKPCTGKCKHFIAAVKEKECRCFFFYGKNAARTVKVYHNRRVMK